MRKLCSGIALFALCCTVALGQPARKARRVAPVATRPAPAPVEPGWIDRVWSQLTGWVETLDNPPEPPERGHNPVPT